MRFYDAILTLALAAEIHGTDKAVSQTAKRVAKALPGRYRQHMYDVINSPSPLRHIKLFLKTMPDDILQHYA
ncbi:MULTISPECIES: hypothetical protein [Pseudomonas]|uniref:DUF7740 domain-containing protein n=1 Tax=Pseudomonas luteola TaxID=47886 RepID=A0A2X2BZ12_PSELU|nr:MULTISPECIES: hypothetical protein [Pseudomonas]MBA1250148.1 hypothetical protein [Pseudomonas zeshuii]MBH3440899.1 hypothetical protein [Pseudomonas luteola]SPZ00001.1 Uncharacterised protein [Pseudomonas luteola]